LPNLMFVFFSLPLRFVPFFLHAAAPLSHGSMWQKRTKAEPSNVEMGCGLK
jgi:hypothetical protein